MDPKLLGLALQNAQGGYDAFLKGQSDAMKAAQMEREAQAQMMDLALKDATLPQRRAAMGFELLKSIPVRNEPRIQQAIALAVDPFSRIAPIQAPGQFDTNSADAFLQMAAGKRPDVNINMPSVGVSANMIGSAMKSGEKQPAQKPLSREETQAQSIEKLRGAGGRAPQSVESIVQPLEGTTSPYQNSAVGPDGVANLQPETITADPNAEQALNFVAGKFKGSPYSALQNPEMLAMMVDSMVRQGFIPGTGIQTGDTMKALSDLEQTQFLAAKQAAQMNQKSQETSAELELKKKLGELENTRTAAALAEKAGASEAQRQLKAQEMVLEAAVRALTASMAANRPRSAGAGKEDPNAKDYRVQLNELQDQLRKSVDAQIAAFGGFVSPEDRADIIKDVAASDPMIKGLASGLREKAGQYPQIANNYSQLFSQMGMPLGGKNQSAPAPKSGGSTLQDRINKIKAQRGGK